ncbi:MAG: hypothetical protein LBT38_00065 [Deltaproteobacteria bacterium]|nr:hypothetical protein [Deltaproteobacteria bacterium]
MSEEGLRIRVSRKFESKNVLSGRRACRKSKIRIRELTKRNCGYSLEAIIEGFNRTLRRWLNYFQRAAEGVFSLLDEFIHRRLRITLLRRNKRKGFGKLRKSHERWPNSFFASKGLRALDLRWEAEEACLTEFHPSEGAS